MRNDFDSLWMPAAGVAAGRLYHPDGWLASVNEGSGSMDLLVLGEKRDQTKAMISAASAWMDIQTAIPFSVSEFTLELLQQIGFEIRIIERLNDGLIEIGGTSIEIPLPTCLELIRTGEMLGILQQTYDDDAPLSWRLNPHGILQIRQMLREQSKKMNAHPKNIRYEIE